jgi:hypothetical protein
MKRLAAADMAGKAARVAGRVQREAAEIQSGLLRLQLCWHCRLLNFSFLLHPSVARASPSRREIDSVKGRVRDEGGYDA